MYLIVGLGNPGAKYDKTRHNIGFEVIDRLSSQKNIDVNQAKFKGLMGQGVIEGEKVILLKPETFMNLSGESVVLAANFYKIKPENIIVVHDDIDLDVGRLRLRAKGSAGGHNGLKSIIASISSENFIRVKVGVGAKMPGQDLANHVLSRFGASEIPKIEESIENATKAVLAIVKDGIDKAMNQFNSVGEIPHL